MKTFSVLSLILISINVSAQEDYIIQIQKDTLKGKIHFRKNSNEVKFTNSLDGTSKVFTPSEIIGFGADGDLYHAVKGDNLKPVFAKVLALGEISLYAYRDYYIIVKGDQLQTLEKTQITNNQATESKKYIGQITAIMQSCQELNSKIQLLKFSQSDFIGIVSEYNSKCSTQKYQQVEMKKKRLRWEKGVWASFILGDVKYEDAVGTSYLANYDFEPGKTFSVGIFANLYLSKRFSLQPELLYTKKEATLNTTLGGSGSLLEYDEYYSVSSIQFPISIRYNLDIGKKNSLYILSGIVNGRIIENNSYVLRNNQYKTEIELNQSEIGFKVGAGFSTRMAEKIKLGIEYQFERSSETASKLDFRRIYLGNSIGLRISF